MRLSVWMKVISGQTERSLRYHTVLLHAIELGFSLVRHLLLFSSFDQQMDKFALEL